ncbi:unnamed protein product [Arabis nemorensis]|uniref:Zinc finger PHD-type domain-containing protein n=1 Tax=Arabis nemorensis TaxID=586526 RepID=A0A565CGB1_9BRAS|nr:unnamed protein product [Arabis nemorensis]
MVSNTHVDDQIVVFKEASPVSSPKNTHVSNKSDLIEASSSNKSALSKNEEQMKSFVQPGADIVENKEDEAENIMMNICDTCGDLGWNKYLAICATCEVGAEHIYCMAVKLKKKPEKWECYDCIEDKDQMEKNEEAGSRKRKAKSLIDPFEISEKPSSQRQPDLLKTQNYNGTVGMDLNEDPIPDLNRDPIPDLNLDPIPDLNLDPVPDLNLDPLPDLNLDPNPGFNLDPNPGLHLSLGHASYTSNFQAKKPNGLSLTPVPGQHYPEEEEEHCAKRPRVNTILFF